MSAFQTTLLGISSLVAILLFYWATLDISQNLSPQGCRMSRMSPSYVLQNHFDTSWTPLAGRYSLWLYREVGWEPNQIHDQDGGVPVLFIPGNAGSSHQVRSIASSATRQFYSFPYVVAPVFTSRSLKPLDFFAVEFNEDLSAFHGTTLEAQISYTSRAITYILSLYPANTSIIIMGHSMGGVVATALLPSPDISAIITMSTPHVLPPARFDSRIDDIYYSNQKRLYSSPTPVVSLCGGATDMMIPSESCVLPPAKEKRIFRRTIFTSALEGAWTGVGHREMVWCHQVRWRVARAALEIGASNTSQGVGVILDKWLRDGHSLPPEISESAGNGFSLPDPASYEVLPRDIPLVLKNPRGSHTYLLPLPTSPSSPSKIVLFVSQGSIPPVSPQNAIPLRVSVFLCAYSPVLEEAGPICNSVQPTSLRLIPNPVPGKTFPVPGEGSDESEGVVLYEADVPAPDTGATPPKWLTVRTEDVDGRGWVVGGFTKEEQVTSSVGILSLLFRSVTISVRDNHTLRMAVAFPNLLTSTLLVYNISPTKRSDSLTCPDHLLAPLILYPSHSSETHYFPLLNPLDRRILLHTHIPAPYISHQPVTRGLYFTIYTTGSAICKSEPEGFAIRIDWFATLGRWATRYPTTLVSWAVGVAALVVFQAWSVSDQAGAPVPTVQQSLLRYTRKTLRHLVLASFLVSFLPLPADYYLGNRGEPLFSPIAPLVLVIASGLVCVSWWVLVALMLPLRLLGQKFSGRPRESVSVRKSSLVSMGFICILIFLFVPWQVAYLGCWLIHLYTCATITYQEASRESVSSLALPLVLMHDTDNYHEDNDAPTPLRIHDLQRQSLYSQIRRDNCPVLAVWVRTLITAGLTTPFDGDHVFLNVAPFLILVDFASWNTSALFERQSLEKILSVRWALAFIVAVAFIIGSRQPYSIFGAARVAFGLVVSIRVGRRYWGGASWSH